MNTKAPSPKGLLALGLFVLSCFGLTLYMWLVFGGTAPLQPKSYRITVPFPDASLIASQADVRIAGVNVGKVISRDLAKDKTTTNAVLQIAPQYAPLRRDTTAVLRQKTVVGETYVELEPGSPTAPMLPDGGSLRPENVRRPVRLDDVLRTFDAPTRAALGSWLTDQGEALRGGGPALSAALAELPPLGRYGGDVLSIFHRQQDDLTALLRQGGGALGALTRRQGQLRSLVRNAATVFHTTAARDAALADTFRALPGFDRELRATATRIGAFSTLATPVVRQLRPSARALSPVLDSTATLAPGLRRLLAGIGPLAASARTGLPALSGVLRPAVPLLRRLKPYLGTLIPSIDYIGDSKRELAGLFANVAAATQATLPASDKSGPLHYARASLVINPETLAAYSRRLRSGRSNPYPHPGGYDQLADGLPTFAGCAGSAPPTLSDEIPKSSSDEVLAYYFTPNPNGPACKTQAPLGSLVGTEALFPHLEALP